MSEETVYSIPAKLDYILEYIKKNRELDKTIYQASHSFQSVTILFNPLQDQLLTQFGNDDPEEFPKLVKAAIITHIQQYADERTVERAKQRFTVKISIDNEVKLRDWTSEHEGLIMSSRCQVLLLHKEEAYARYVKYHCHKCECFEEFTSEPANKEDIVCRTEKCERHGKRLLRDVASVKSGRIRRVIIQELSEEAKHGSPRIIDAEIRDDDVANTFLGQRKKIVGVFRTVPQKYGDRSNIMIRILSTFDLTDLDMVLPTEEQIIRFKKLAESQDYFELLTRSWAPEILGEKLAKLCVILSRVGGVKVDTLRGLIHTLLIGNPSVGKTKILEHLELVTQRSAFATGGSSSGSGITVSLDRLPNGTKVPRAGIVPLCSGSHVALDEISQFDDEDLDKLYHCMESGKIPFRKGGFNEMLDADTSIKAGANPKGYEYDFDYGMLDNIKLPKPLLSRFDLIVNMLATESLIEERKVIDHISLIRKNGIADYVKTQNLLTTDEQLRLYNYAEKMTPTMSEKAETFIKDFQLTMKQIELDESQKKGAKKIDRRFFEAMYRTAAAIAKLHFSVTVMIEHAVLAVEIYKQTLQTFGLKTDKGVTQLNMSTAHEDADTAFDFAFNALKNEKNSDLLPEHEILDSMVQHFPQHWKDKVKAAKFFNAKRKEGKLDYHEGLFKLAS